MPLTAVPTTVPISLLPGLKSDRPVVASEAFTIDCADCMHQQPRCATTAWSRSSSVASPRTPSWSTPRRPAPCACSSRPVWCPGVRHSRQVG